MFSCLCLGSNDTYRPRNPAWTCKLRACADLGATRSTAVFGALDESYEGGAGVAWACSGAPEGADLVLHRILTKTAPIAHPCHEREQCRMSGRSG